MNTSLKYPFACVFLCMMIWVFVYGIHRNFFVKNLHEHTSSHSCCSAGHAHGQAKQVVDGHCHERVKDVHGALLAQEHCIAHESGSHESCRGVAPQIVSSGQLWRSVQDKVRDTVVQIFSQVAVIDFLQPYKTPMQGSMNGSGFFISDRGEIITNAHVVEQAKAVWIQIPSLGKRIIDVEVVGVSPERDLALLQVTEEGLAIIRKELGEVPFLSLGDSDIVHRSDEVLALGYPLGQQSLKSTTGVVSGRENNMIQISAAINPGSSGGPLVNSVGEVIGINAAAILEAQNVGYAIPITDLKIVLPDLHKMKLVKKPFLGVLFNNATEYLTSYLGNPLPGGCYVVEVIAGSTLEKAGVKRGDMLYEINGYRVDVFGEMRVEWSEDKISIIDFVSRLAIGEKVDLVVYRHGVRNELSVIFDYAEPRTIRKVYPGYEDIDYEIFAGMVVMDLTINHIKLLRDQAPGLAKYAEMHHMNQHALVITHIFPSSQLYRSRTLNIGNTINEVNGASVTNLAQLREALHNGVNREMLTIKASDNVGGTTDHILVVLPMEKILCEETQLAQIYRYAITDNTKDLLRIASCANHLQELSSPATSVVS